MATEQKQDKQPYSEWEKPLFDAWSEHGFFERTPGFGKNGAQSYTVVIPPPNVTGVLHMGHALNDTIQDACVRRARMQGYQTRWIVGVDHAGIATQTKVDKHLAEQGIDRHEIGREAFIEACQEWRDEYGGIIINQIKAMGCSCDYEHEQFTMSPSLSRAVRKVFCDWYHDDLIFRGQRIVNWCPHCTTAIADDEAEYEEEPSHLWHLRYPLTEPVDGMEYLVVATTRPETMLGDTGIAVSPQDERYKNLVGKTVMLPIVNREIPIVADFVVDKEFGTGCVKVTPAHDPNDYAIGQRNDLDQINIFDEHAVVVDGFGKFSGMTRDEAREAVVAEFEELGLLDKIEDHTHSVMHCYRCHTTLEPWLSEQWFVAVDRLKEPARKVVEEGNVQFYPARWAQVYLDWLDNLKDWCISRQLWWGQQIPAYYLPTGGYVVAETPEQALELARAKSGNPDLSLHELRQDPDVLDTWFSSWLWPISVFDGINRPDNEEIRYYYPTNDLVTAPDILFFWVARMIIAGYEYRGERPFRNVYLTGIVRDKLRRKMSKSLGNSPDPLDLIAQYGADGVRMAMLLCSAAGNDLLFDDSLCEQGRNFGNKIWNAYRLVSGWPVDESLAQSECNAAAVRWFDSMLEKTLRQVEEHFAEYRISEALMLIYKLFWDEFSGWYLEMVKPAYGQPIDRPTLDATIGFFDKLMRLLHPFMPFVTEEIWQDIAPRRDGESVSLAPMPEPAPCDETLLEQVELLKETVTAVRNVRKQRNLPAKEPLELRVIADENYHPELGALLRKTANLTDVETVAEKPADAASFIVKTTQYFVPLDGKIDVEEELKKLQHDLAYYEGFLASVRKKLGNERFVQDAPAQVVENERAKQNDAEAKIKALKERIATLGR